MNEVKIPYTMNILKTFSAIILTKSVAENLVKGEKEAKERAAKAIRQLESERGKPYGQ